jgi:hypothetical protein
MTKKKLTKTQRKTEVIKNLSNTIHKESLKVGGGNKELMKKFQEKLDKLQGQ